MRFLKKNFSGDPFIHRGRVASRPIDAGEPRLISKSGLSRPITIGSELKSGNWPDVLFTKVQNQISAACVNSVSRMLIDTIFAISFEPLFNKADLVEKLPGKIAVNDSIKRIIR